MYSFCSHDEIPESLLALYQKTFFPPQVCRLCREPATVFSSPSSSSSPSSFLASIHTHTHTRTLSTHTHTYIHTHTRRLTQAPPFSPLHGEGGMDGMGSQLSLFHTHTHPVARALETSMLLGGGFFCCFAIFRRCCCWMMCVCACVCVCGNGWGLEIW